MVRRPYGGNRPDALICPYPSCPTVSSDLSLVEDIILAALEQWYQHLTCEVRQERPCPFAEIRSLQASLETVSSQLDRTNRQIAKAHDLLEQGIYSTEVFLSRTHELSSRQSGLMAQKAALTEELARYRQSCVEISQPPPHRRHIMEIYRETDEAKEKSSLLKSLLDHAVYAKTARLRWNNCPGKGLEITLYPRLPHDEPPHG